MNSSEVIVQFPVPATTEVTANVSPLLGRRLLHLEDQIRRHYTNLRRRRQPSYRPKDKEEAFARAAELVHRHHADPHEFVDAQFALNTQGSYPWPNQIGGEVAVERWRQHRAVRDQDERPAPTAGGADSYRTVQFAARLEEAWRCQCTYVELLRKRRGLSDEAIFLGEGLPLRAWFRLSCAPEPLLRAVDTRFGEAARAQLRTDEPLAGYLQHLLTTTPLTTTTVNHATLRPLRPIVSRGAPGAPLPYPRIIPLPARGGDAPARASGF